MKEHRISRREFLKLSSLASFGLFLPEDLPSGGKLKGISEYELVFSEPTIGWVQARQMPVYFIPLGKDSFYDEKREISQWKITGIAPGFKGIYTFEGPGGYLTVAPLHHVSGDRALPVAVLERGRIASGVRIGEERFGTIKTEPLVEYSMMDSFYPNKIHNLLEFSAQMARHQLNEGPFRAGTSYSLLKILNIPGNRNFKEGLTSTSQRTKGGGVCAGATTLAHTLEQLKVSFEEIQPHGHYSLYWVGSLDPEINLTTDATIELGETAYDLKWKMPPGKDFYLSAMPVVAVSGAPQPSGLGQANARLFLSFTLSAQRPNLERELARIESLQREYQDYNLGKGKGPNLESGELIGFEPWGSNIDIIAREIFPEEETSQFEEELKSIPYLAEIVTLRNLVEKYKSLYPPKKVAAGEAPRLGDYLKSSDWYRVLSRAKRQSLGEALGHFNYYTYEYKGQPLQCVGWVILLSQLGYPESPENVSRSGVSFARELVPDRIRLENYYETRQNGFTTLKVNSLEEIEVGDLFLGYELLFTESPGHIGAIVAKKKVNGETFLLATDANRKEDGLVRVFQIHRGNMYGILGNPPKKWVVIRK